MNLMPGRRTLLRTAAWSAPAVSLAAAAPAFATSDLPAPLEITSSRTANDAAEVEIRNTGASALSVTVTFTPVPDEDEDGSLQAYSGFEGFARSSTAPYSLTGTLEAGSSISALCWWRAPETSQVTTTIDATANGVADAQHTIDITA